MIRRSYEVMIGMELALVLLPSTAVYLSVAVLSLAGGFDDWWSLPTGIYAYAGCCLGAAWYGALVLLMRGRSGLRDVPVVVVAVGVGGPIWIATSWILPRLVELPPVDEIPAGLTFFSGGFFGIPSALVGTHLLIEWCVALRRPLVRRSAV